MNFEDIIPRSVLQNVAEVMADCFRNQVRKGWAFCAGSLRSRLLWETRSPHSEDTHAALGQVTWWGAEPLPTATIELRNGSFGPSAQPSYETESA